MALKGLRYDTKIAGYAHDNGKGIISGEQMGYCEKDTNTYHRFEKDIRTKLDL